MSFVSAEQTAAPSGSMYRRIVRNSALFAGGTAASALFTMLAVAVAARALDARDFGVLILLQNAVLMLRALTTFSTQQPVIKLGSAALAESDRERLSATVSMALIVDFVACLLAFAIAAVSIETARRTIGLADQDVGSSWILAVSLLFTGYPMSNGIFRLYDRFGLLSLIQGVSAIALLVAYALLWMAGASLHAFVWVWAVYLSLTSLVQLWISLRLVHRDGVRIRLKPRLFATDDGQTLLHYCWSTWGTSTAETVRTNGDSLLIGAIISVEAAGIYNVARQLAGVLRKLNVVYMSTVFPEIAWLAARGNNDGAKRLNRRLFWAGIGIAAAAIGLAAIFGEPIIRLLFGERFMAAFVPLVILTAAAAGLLISYTPSMYVQIFRGPRLLLLLHVIATVVFAVAAVALTSIWSIAGMALAQLVFAIVLTLLCNLVLRKPARVPSSVLKDRLPDYPDLADD
jgi:O-antigen/teichoic acid export membrane protein